MSHSFNSQGRRGIGAEVLALIVLGILVIGAGLFFLTSEVVDSRTEDRRERHLQEIERLRLEQRDALAAMEKACDQFCSTARAMRADLRAAVVEITRSIDRGLRPNERVTRVESEAENLKARQQERQKAAGER